MIRRRCPPWRRRSSGGTTPVSRATPRPPPPRRPALRRPRSAPPRSRSPAPPASPARAAAISEFCYSFLPRSPVNKLPKTTSIPQEEAKSDDVDESDVALVERCRGGDPEAFRAVFEKYQRRAYSLALSVVHNQDE